MENQMARKYIFPLAQLIQSGLRLVIPNCKAGDQHVIVRCDDGEQYSFNIINGTQCVCTYSREEQKFFDVFFNEYSIVGTVV